MTNRDNDDIADALHGLASGDHVEPELPEGSGTGQAHHLDAAAPSPAPPSPAPRPPAAPFRATPKPMPPSAPGSAAATPAPVRPNVPPMRPRAHPQPQPPPGTRPPAPPASRAGPARPAAPVQPGGVSRNVLPPGTRAPAPPLSPNLTPPGGAASPASVPADVETTDVQPVDEDDRVIVPAALLSSLGPRTHPPAAPREPLFKSLRFRQTAIPVLLTTGLLLLFVTALKFVVNRDAVLATLPVGTCLAMAGAGILLLGVAALNMAQVRRQRGAGRPGAAPKG
jgi:hypothetical protein